MAPSVISQTKALSWRYCISLYRSPVRSLIRVILWPALCIIMLILALEGLEKVEEDLGSSITPEYFMSSLLVFITVFHAWAFSEWLVTDKVTGFKSLMISMGLKRSSYYLSNSICFIANVLPLTIIIAVVSIIYIFKESNSSPVTIVVLLTLFTIHLTSTVFAITSFITSTTFTIVVPGLIFFSGVWHYGVNHLMKISSAPWQPLILFTASLSPYGSIVIFCDSYTLCKSNSTNCDRTQIISISGREAVSQPTYLILIAMTFWTLVAFAFSRWFDEICPWQVDSAVKKPFFCLEAASQYKELPSDDEQASRGSKYFQQCMANREVGIRVSKLTKNYKSKPVVDDVTFNIYKGETTLLLGHNGAGKTTLMDMILGKLSPSNGRTMFRDRYGFLSESRGSLRIGVCPQTSILDANLTVEQHLNLFADIKSSRMSREEYKNHIYTTLEDVSLTAHRSKLPSELSGGMKRKLNLAMAFVGQSSILILDEPSSGLDPDSRVFIWNAIRRYRSDRTVLLSTQHMEEADYLGDRIAIMREGKIICCGSSIFLNNIFGSGYKLRIECHASKRKQVLAFVRKYLEKAKPSETDCPNSSDNRSTGAKKDPIIDFVIELGDDRDSEMNLIRMLKEIETNSEALHIISHGLRSSSIEEVLLNTNKSLSCEPQADQLTLTSKSGHLATLVNPLLANYSSFSSGQMALIRALSIKHVLCHIEEWRNFLVYRLVVPLFILWYLIRGFSSSTNSSTYTTPLHLAAVFCHFVFYPTREKVSKFKTMQMTSCANLVVYWLSQLIADFATIVIASIGINLFLIISFEGEYISSSFVVHSLATLAIILFGIAAAFFAYILSNILTDYNTSTGYHILFYSISPIESIIITWFQHGMSKDLTWLKKAVEMFFIAIFPTDAFGYILFGFQSNCYIKPKGSQACIRTQKAVLIGLIALFCQIIVYAGILTFIERKNLDLSKYWSWRNIVANFRKVPPSSEMREFDEDVIEESLKATRLINNVPRDTYSLVATDLRKSYVRGVKVVDHLSLTVNRAECFGLLGVNGAGKSTTFSMIVAEVRPDNGRIWVNGNYSYANIDKYRRTLGYDPQSNPELSLKVVDALYLMARLRQVHEQSIHMLVKSVLELLEMNEHANKSAKDLSGGTKRKLALGMSLLGNPELLALDEPTAGIDPIARRSVWQLLRSLRTQHGASIIISSHAMEECEAICDRISIMARGRLRCIGTFLHLRSKFAQGFSIKLQFSVGNGEISPSTSNDKITSEINRRLEADIGPSVKLVDTNVNSATFNISDKNVGRSTVFEILREFRQKYPKISYVLNDSSLEDIFIELAREQDQLNANN